MHLKLAFLMKRGLGLDFRVQESLNPQRGGQRQSDTKWRNDASKGRKGQTVAVQTLVD